MRRVIITGAGGFIGSMLTKKMVENGVMVVAVSSGFNDGFPDGPLVSRRETTIGDAESLLAIVPNDEYDAFYHLAWRGVNGSAKRDPAKQWNNVRITLECAAAARRLGCKRFLCAGTVAERVVESLPNLEEVPGSAMYGVAKHCARTMLEAYSKTVGYECIWMQFSNVYGPSNATGNLISYALGELAGGRAAEFGPANQPYDFVCVDDLVEAAYRLGFCDTRKRFYFIGSGEPKVLKDYLIEVGEACGRLDLVRIGVRPDDGITYSEEMFDISDLVADIGQYVTHSFEAHMAHTVGSY